MEYWTEVLKNPSKFDAHEMFLMSNDWLTCPTSIIKTERNELDCPIDDRVFQLGLAFQQAIIEKDFNEARNIIAQIKKYA